MNKLRTADTDYFVSAVLNNFLDYAFLDFEVILSAILVTMTQRMIVKTISGKVLPTIMSTFIRKRYAAKPASHTIMLQMSTALLALSFLRMKKSAI